MGTSAGWNPSRSRVKIPRSWHRLAAVHSPPRYLIFCFQSFQGLKIWATEEPVSGAHICSGGANVWTSSPFSSSKWPFLRKHRLPQPNWETRAEPCFTLRGRESFYQKIKEITPTTVWLEELTSESLHWEGHILLSSSTAEAQSSKAGTMNPDPIFSKVEFSDKVCLTHASDHLHMRSVPPLMLSCHN